MITDTDLIGIISASCIMFLFIIGFIALLARTCYKRLERKKREQIASNIIHRQLQSESAEIAYQLHSMGSLSEISSNDPRRMSNYRPRILREDEQTSLDEDVSSDSAEDREFRKSRYKKKTRSPEKNGDAEISRAVSVIHVTSNDINVRGKREVKGNGQVIEGHVTVPHNTAQYNRDEILQRQPEHQGRVQTVQYEIFPQTAHSTRTVGGDVVRGRIIKQNVSMRPDGQLVITSSEETDAGLAVSKRSTQKDEDSSIATPVVGDEMKRYTTVQNLATDDGFARVSFTLGETEFSEARQSAPGTIHESIYSYKRNSPEISQSNNANIDQFSHTAQSFSLKDTIFAAKKDEIVDNKGYNDDEVEESLNNKERTPEVVVVVGADDSANDIQNSSNHTEESHPISEHTTHEDDDTVSRLQEDSLSLFYSDSKNYKVIKKHSAHKPPDWLVKTYAESAASSMEQVESFTQAVQTVETAVITEESSNAFYKEGQKVSFANINTFVPDHDTWTGEDYSINHPEPDYPDDGETYTVTDHVDPDSGVITRAATHVYSGVQNSEDGAVTTTSSRTATVVRQLRRHANDTQEKTSPLLRIPKAPWEIEQSEVTPGSDFSVMAVHTRRMSSEIISVDNSSPTVLEIEP